jgi:hypothetical protein
MTVVQNNTSARDKMLQRVLNLRARGEDDASSEAEMNTALTMAMKLMEAYNIEEAELAIAEADGRIQLEIVEKTSDTSLLKGTKQKHKIMNVLFAISKFTETRVVVNALAGNIKFTGHRPDTELANYLVGLIRGSLDREFENYKVRIAGRIGYGAKTSFQNAMASRVSTRLYDMVRERDENRAENKRAAERLKIENAATASSTALVISEIAEQKVKEVEAEFRKSYPRLGKVKTSYRSTNSNAFSAGREAGSRVNFGRALGGSSATQIS